MTKRSFPTRLPIALTIAGSDSGGGAGIQADLKTFAALGVHGATVLTCVTAQNPRRVLALGPCRPALVRRQLEAVFEELKPAAAKTGMLYSEGIIRTVAEWLREHPVPLVVDPVLISTSGTRLLAASAVKTLCRRLLPLARIITPNIREAEVLAAVRIRSLDDMRAAARRLREQFGAAVLLKGGHLKHLEAATDVFYDGARELVLREPFVRRVRTHGTGCTCSAAITAYLACGIPLPVSVARAKQFVTRAIARSHAVGRHRVLNSLTPLQPD